MTSANDTAGGVEEFTAHGQAWQLRHITPGLRAAFSRWCVRRAYDRLEEDRLCLPADRWQAKAKRLDDATNAGHYNWGSPLGAVTAGEGLAEMFRTAEGQAELVRLLLVMPPGVAKLSPAEAYALIEADGESFSRAMTEALRAVPNSQAPGKTSGGESERANASEEAAA